MKRDLQREAVKKFGMDVQLLHAVEELTELSLEIQRHLRRRREGLGVSRPEVFDLAREFCDVRNGLATVELYLESVEGGSMVPIFQNEKDEKFAGMIDKAPLPENPGALRRMDIPELVKRPEVTTWCTGCFYKTTTGARCPDGCPEECSRERIIFKEKKVRG